MGAAALYPSLAAHTAFQEHVTDLHILLTTRKIMRFTYVRHSCQKSIEWGWKSRIDLIDYAIRPSSYLYRFNSYL